MLPKVHYAAKRSSKKGRGRTINMEEFAKIRYSYLYDPLLPHVSPKKLWTTKDDEGSYEKAFGDNGCLLENWTNSVLDEALLAVVFHDLATSQAKELKKQDRNNTYFYRCRFHIVALVGDYMRSHQASSPHSLLSDKEKCHSEWSTIWNEASRVIQTEHRRYTTRSDQSPMTLYTFVRSDPIWKGMLQDFRFNLKLKT